MNAENYRPCPACSSIEHDLRNCPELELRLGNIIPPSATAPSESFANVSTECGCKDPDVFDWIQAMKLFAGGNDIQVNMGGAWIDIIPMGGIVCFNSAYSFRRKPVPEPKYDRKTIVSDLLPTRLALLEARVENIHQALQGKGIL